MDKDARERVLKYCGAEGGSWEDGCRAIIRTLMGSAAGLVILPVQDLLVYGADTRMNTPGTSESNWAFRLTGEQLTDIPTGMLFELNRLFDR